MKDFLLIAANFFGYAQEIVGELEARGRKVMWFEDRPSTDSKTKALIRIAPWIIQNKSDCYFRSIIKEAKKHKIRDVLVIKGEALSPDLVREMRLALPNARFVLYFWDSFRNMPLNSMEKVGLFDKVLSFDPIDVKRDQRLIYQPLFFLRDYLKLAPGSSGDTDLLFIGTSHTDRYGVLKKIKQQLPANVSFKQILYLQNRGIYLAKKLLMPSYWSAHSSEFIFKPLTKFQVLEYISRSRILIDIERKIQTGLTMRTIESIGCSRKLITTNPFISKADFFDQKNQLFIDRDCPTIPMEFLKSSWQPIAGDLRDRYSINGWLDQVIG